MNKYFNIQTMADSDQGGTSFANTVLESGELPYRSRKTEQHDNSQETSVGATDISQSHTEDDVFGTTTLHIDNGNGSDVTTMFDKNEKKLKRNQIGLFHCGLLKSIISGKSDFTIIFSYDGSKLTWVIMYVFQIISIVHKLANGLATGNEVTKEIFRDKIVKGKESEFISFPNIEKYIDQFQNNQYVHNGLQNIINKKQSGFAIIEHYDPSNKSKPTIDDFENYISTQPIYRNYETTPKFYRNCVEIPNEQPIGFWNFNNSNNFIIISFKLFANIIEGEVVINYNNDFYRLSEKGKIDGPKLRNFEQDINTTDEKGEKIWIPYELRATIVSVGLSRLQSNLLDCDQKEMSIPVIETDYGVNGAGGTTRLPAYFKKYSSFPSNETTNTRQSIYIPQESIVKLLPVFGINGHKDTPNLEAPCSIAYKTLSFQLLIHKFIARKFGRTFIEKLYDGKSKDIELKAKHNPWNGPMVCELIDTHGYSEETQKYITTDDINIIVRGQNITPQVKERWYREIIDEDYVCILEPQVEQQSPSPASSEARFPSPSPSPSASPAFSEARSVSPSPSPSPRPASPQPRSTSPVPPTPITRSSPSPFLDNGENEDENEKIRKLVEENRKLKEENQKLNEENQKLNEENRQLMSLYVFK